MADSPRIAERDKRTNTMRLKPEFKSWLEAQSSKTAHKVEGETVEIMSWQVFDSGLFFIVFLDKQSATIFKTFWT